ERSWGPTPLADQQAAGGLMWVTGDLMFLVAVLAIVFTWMRHEERETVRLDARLDAERAAIRDREVLLEARQAREVLARRPGTEATDVRGQPGIGADSSAR
ncbi:MAG TPA: cytochrome c oxidase assembly protein, partial [Candidatus Limnocylindrales bacterium]